MKDRGDKLPGLASIVEMDDDIENLLVSTDPDTSGAMPQPLPRDKVLDIIDDVWPITDKARGICDQSGRSHSKAEFPPTSSRSLSETH